MRYELFQEDDRTVVSGSWREREPLNHDWLADFNSLDEQWLHWFVSCKILEGKGIRARIQVCVVTFQDGDLSNTFLQ